MSAVLAALLAGLVTAIGVLVLLTGGVLAALLAALTLVFLASLLTAAFVIATLVLLALILIHRSLLGIICLPRNANQRTRGPFHKVPCGQIFMHAGQASRRWRNFAGVGVRASG